MFVPRTFIVAGIALIAISLGASGHGLWWLIGLVWAFGWMHDGRRSCHVGRRRHRAEPRLDDRLDGRLDDRPDDQPVSSPTARGPVAQPDPTHDRHEAFPVR
ncbi:hypothetical protein ACXR8F_14245 [Terrabacter sp. AAH1]